MDSTPTAAPWLYLVFVAFIVARFLWRELRVRKMAVKQLWYAPAFVAVIAVWLVYMTLTAAPYILVTLVIPTVAALVVGAGLGLAVAHFTTVQGGANGVAIVRGSWITVAIWLGAFALRLVGRLAVGSASMADQLMLNTALIVLIAAAIGVVRYRIYVEAAKSPAVPESAL